MAMDNPEKKAPFEGYDTVQGETTTYLVVAQSGPAYLSLAPTDLINGKRFDAPQHTILSCRIRCSFAPEDEDSNVVNMGTTQPGVHFNIPWQKNGIYYASTPVLFPFGGNMTEGGEGLFVFADRLKSGEVASALVDFVKQVVESNEGAFLITQEDHLKQALQGMFQTWAEKVLASGNRAKAVAKILKAGDGVGHYPSELLKAGIDEETGGDPEHDDDLDDGEKDELQH